MAGDVLTVEGDPQDGEPLVRPVMRAGKRLQLAEPLTDIRARSANELKRLPAPLRRLTNGPSYPVTVAPALRALIETVDRETTRN